MAPGGPDDHDVAAGLARLEGYLLCQSEIQRAHAEAESFAGRLPWLTTAQREEVVAHYVEEQLRLSKEVLQRIATRCAELRDEYTTRYETLRQRLLCRCAALVLASAALCATACVVAFTTRLR
ncbi:hypothetical protein ACFS5L_33105 [Streptomyces phyllanthi]|uniref:Cytochrome C oxidase subunit I n=1 Tax=Streptomyces phyllanthi TaxID=1803180 RepID=A0A5N8WAC8_9ACTN|nr:hypothetical protein [Streptomyces phyllanthi]MPY43746.1 hypothetical protein [Streptomyces phyllanthi]